MGGAVNTVKRVGMDVATGGMAEFARKDPFGVPVGNANPIYNATNKLLPPWMTGGSTPNIGGGGPFQVDQAQRSADESAITGLGEKQYQETMNELPSAVNNAVLQSLPGVQEKLNSQHLLNSTALPAEIARQQQQFAQSLAIPALQGRQGTQTAALQRGLSLEDFINQANVSKSIGQSFTPQQPSGKQNFGTVASGIGALSPWASALKGVDTVVPAGATVQHSGK